MTHDQQTYKRAASAALVGLVTQTVLSLAALVLAMWALSPAVSAVTWHFFGGLPIWIVLLMIYNQHRLERAEALETEQLAARDAAAAAIFDERAQDLHVARRRLDRLYKWGLGGVSVLLAIYLMAVGAVMLYGNYASLQGETLVQNALRDAISPAPLAFIAVALALVAFLVARYVAGMTRIAQWQLLRGGASYLMGNALLALLIFAAAVYLTIFSSELGFVILALAVPAIMILIGFEMALTFLLSAYRPRRAGEMPRPAFDSRLLGWTTSPESLGRIISDTLNYQFGFEISRSWFYRLLSRAMTPLIILGLVALMLISSLVIVEPHERAIIMHFGAIVPSGPQTSTGRMLAAQPGSHLKLPWPLGTVRKYDVERVHQIVAGSSRKGVKIDAPAILWTTTHVEEEEYLPTAPSQHRSVGGQRQGDAPDEEDRAAGGVALLAAEVAVQYKIRDLDQYIKVVQDDLQMQRLLTVIADRCVSEHFVTHDIDSLLSAGRGKASERLRVSIQEQADKLELGVEIVFVGLAGIHPPQKDKVAESFHAQIAAYQEAQSTINNAEKTAVQILTEAAGSREMAQRIDAAINELQKLKLAGADEARIEQAEREVRRLLESARGTVAQVIHEAQAYRWQRELSAQADVRSFTAAEAAYKRAPSYYVQRAYYEALAQYMPLTRKFIVDAEHLEVPPVYLLEFKESAGAAGGLFEEKE